MWGAALLRGIKLVLHHGGPKNRHLPKGVNLLYEHIHLEPLGSTHHNTCELRKDKQAFNDS